MRITILAATTFEIQPTIEFLRHQDFRVNENHYSILIGGVGVLSTAYQLTKHILEQKPEYIVQAGIAGSFQQKFAPGSIA